MVTPQPAKKDRQRVSCLAKALASRSGSKTVGRVAIL